MMTVVYMLGCICVEYVNNVLNDRWEKCAFVWEGYLGNTMWDSVLDDQGWSLWWAFKGGGRY